MSVERKTYTQKARAKINLTLHVGDVCDGYHPLESLVVFADLGDDLVLNFDGDMIAPCLEIAGEFAQGLSVEADNSILKAAHLFEQFFPKPPKFHLTKNLPIASGIGGGTADAAASVRLLEEAMESADCHDIDLKTLGADFSVCYESQTCMMTGIGHDLSMLPDQGQLCAILVNSNVEVSTKKVFEKFDKTSCSQVNLGHLKNISLLEIAKAGRNDLQKPAISLAPSIQTVLDEIAIQADCQLTRMSGSGATCFGIFPTRLAAQNAARAIKEKHRDWWCVATVLGDFV